MIRSTLYKIDNKNKIRIWYIETNDSDSYSICHGVDGGIITKTKEQRVTPKNIGRSNETTIEQQLSLEVNSLYTKQIKLGYRYTVDEAECVNIVEPMLAYSYSKFSKKINIFDGNWIAQTKLNGHRCIFDGITLLTRKNEEYLNCGHILEDCLKTKYILDGELFNLDLRDKLNELSKILRKTKNITQADRDISRDIVRYYIYDIPGLDDKPYSYRKAIIDNEIIPSSPYFCRLDDYAFTDRQELDYLLDTHIQNRHEGLILRNLNSLYECKRSKNLLKYKPEDDDEAIIVDIKPGSGDWQNAGKVISLNWNGKMFDASFKGSLKQAEQFLDEKDKWLGKKVTFMYMGLTGLGIPNYARIDIDNCLKELI